MICLSPSPQVGLIKYSISLSKMWKYISPSCWSLTLSLLSRLLGLVIPEVTVVVRDTVNRLHTVSCRLSDLSWSRLLCSVPVQCPLCDMLPPMFSTKLYLLQLCCLFSSLKQNYVTFFKTLEYHQNHLDGTVSSNEFWI